MAVIALRSPAAAPVPVQVSPWESAPDHARQYAKLRMVVVRAVEDRLPGRSEADQIARLIKKIHAGTADAVLMDAALKLGHEGTPVAVKTVQRWMKQYRDGGLVGLLDKRLGKQRPDYGWEARAVELFNTHANRKMATVALLLQQEGYSNAKASLVRHYIKSLPAQLSQNSPKRVGPHEWRLRHGAYREQTTDNLKPGQVYQADGHTCDVYVAHPITGRPIRPELIVWLDIASRMPVGAWLCYHEAQKDVIFSFGDALVRQDHSPLLVHTDNGKFKAAMLTDEATGMYARFSVAHRLAIPGNPHGKGHIERFFGTIRERHDKNFEHYCGHDVAEGHNRRLSALVKTGKVELVGFFEYQRSIFDWLFRLYPQMPHTALDGQSPATVWTAGFVRRALGINAALVVRPRLSRKVNNLRVKLFGRTYSHAALADFNPGRVMVEFDMRTAETVRCLTADGRFICEAKKIAEEEYVSSSVLQDLEIKANRDALKRIERDREERMQRLRGTYTAEDTLRALDDFSTPPLPAEPQNEEGADELPLIDPLDLSYSDE